VGYCGRKGPAVLYDHLRAAPRGATGEHGAAAAHTCRERISELPTTYLKNIYYDAVVYDQPTLEYLVNFAGSERVLYGSDYPHKVGDMPGCLERVNALPEQVARAVAGENAAKLSRL
jgi:aminocarboxymuconate-semialdehyde decarboxylase